MTNTNRQPAGSPVGGQFAETTGTEATINLSPVAATPVFVPGSIVTLPATDGGRVPVVVRAIDGDTAMVSDPYISNGANGMFFQVAAIEPFEGAPTVTTMTAAREWLATPAATRPVEDPDVRADRAGKAAWNAAFAQYGHDCDAGCEPGCHDFAGDMADDAQAEAIARAYARAAANSTARDSAAR